MGISEIIQEKKEQILALSAKYGASNVRIFGSVANGTADENSDIDFLVDLEKGRSLCKGVVSKGPPNYVFRWHSSQPFLTGHTDGYTNRHANRCAEAHVADRRAECRSERGAHDDACSHSGTPLARFLGGGIVRFVWH